MVNLFNYIPRKSPIHQLTGASKFLLLLLWMFAAMVSFNTPFLLVLTIISLILFRLSRIKLREISFLLTLTFVFMVLNNLLIYLFSPELGVEIYGSRHEIGHIWGPYSVTLEQLLYHLNVFLKYTATIPIVLLFVATTDPSEFAASLSKIGISYRISYGVSLSLRYIPGLVEEYRMIALSQQARGIEMSKKENIFKRLKASANIIIPLILSSFDRIETIANAMELRGFGKHKKRTWYRGKNFQLNDFLAIAFGLSLLIFSLFYNFYNGSRFWNPFL